MIGCFEYGNESLFHTRQGVCQHAEQLSASEERPCCMELISYLMCLKNLCKANISVVFKTDMNISRLLGFCFVV